MGGCHPPLVQKKGQETEKGALVKHLSPPHPFGAPLRPLTVERVELGARDEGRARAHRFEVFAKFCDLGLGFVYLRGELRVGWSALDPHQFCRCGFDLRPQRLVTLHERLCLFYESGDLVIGERIEIALVCDEECVLA